MKKRLEYRKACLFEWICRRSAQKAPGFSRNIPGVLCALAVLLALPPPVFSQQITRFAVVDYNRILSSFNVRNNVYAELEKKSAQVQVELDKRKKEIDDMQKKIEETQKSIVETAAIAAAEQAEAEAETAEKNLRIRTMVNRQNQQKMQEAELSRLRNEIVKKSEALKDYYQKKTAELEAEKNRLTVNSATTEVINQINAQVSLTAESEGYTMVLDKNTKGIVWFSRSVDITDKVISALAAKIKR